MKNLKVFQTDKINVDETLVGHCIDADNNRLLVLANDFRIYETQGDQLDQAKEVHHHLDRQALDLSSCLSVDDVILVDFVVESGSILVALKCGKLIRLGVSSFSPPSASIYSHPKDVTSVKLSPDQDLIALADCESELFILSSDCSVIHKANALTQNDSVHKPVGVGWGSKETQFFGLDGRLSKEKQAQETIVLGEEELINATTIESSDIFKQFRRRHERNTVLDWRGDGQYLATLTYIPENSKHYLKVWNRHLDLQYMSEQLVTMERGLLSWIPNGQYVCCAQRRDNRVNEIAMFEKNGMIHQRVTLPTFMPHLYIKDLLWSPNSKILALIVTQFVTTTKSQVTQKHMLMLYTMQNFHYYLKYSCQLPSNDTHYSLRWNPIHHNILYVSSDNGRCVEYNCTLAVEQSQHQSTVAVIDSNKLLITPLKICNVPPPMSAIEMKFESPITHLIPNTRFFNKSLVLTLDGRLYYNDSTSKNTNIEVSCRFENDKVKKFSEDFRSFTFIEFAKSHSYQNYTPIGDTAIIVTHQHRSDCYVLIFSIVDDIEKLVGVIKNRQAVSIVSDSYQAESDSIILLLDDSSCVQLSLTTGQIRLRFQIKVTNERLFVKETQYVAQFDYVLVLTLDSTLRINEHIIVSNCCTSFKVSENFLVYTTTENMISILPLDRLAGKDSVTEAGSWSQPIENGGTLVLVSEDESKVILQMPRGNLEILHPRIMVLLRLTIHLDNSEYVATMKLARRYRVDLNFICDYLLKCDLEKFYDENLYEFANAIALYDPSLLNLFIAELGKDDTIQGRYRNVMMYLPEKYSKLGDINANTNADKVNRICSTMRLPLENLFLQPRLLCLLKQEPRKTGEALLLIHKISDKEQREAALKFVLYFINIEQLFLDAISTYDTDVALMVASASSKDPKEYLALLDSFNSIKSLNLRKFKMDSHIKNYEKAFTNLLIYLQEDENKLETKSQLLELVVSKRIYKHAIKACFDHFVDFVQLTTGKCGVDSIFDQLCTELWIKYGDYLLEKRYYLEASLAYLKSIVNEHQPDERLFDNVIKCLLLANEWERCIAVIERFKISAAKREVALLKIRKSIQSLGHVLEGLLVMQLSKNDDDAFHLVSVKRWHLATALVSPSSRSKLVEEINRDIQSELTETSTEFLSEISAAREHFERFKVLALTPQKTEQFEYGDTVNADSLSTIDGSETTSVTMSASLQSMGKVARSGAPSIKTRASSKSNKSQSSKKKKRMQLKLGSRYEDMALVVELQKFIKNQQIREGLVRHVLAAQVEFYSSGRPYVDGVRLNGLVAERHKLAREILSALWPEGEDNVYSVYKRFGKSIATGENIDNDEINLLLKPDLSSAPSLFELY